MTQIKSLNDLHIAGTRGIVIAAWIASLVLAWRALALGGPSTEALVFSVLANLVPTYFAYTKSTDTKVSYSVAMMVAVQPALFVYALQLSPWQIDMHMYFFVGLAMLAIYCSLRPIILASVLIAGHHLVLSLVSSDWVFPQGGGFERVGIHALAVVLQAGALGVIAESLAKLFHAQEASKARRGRLLKEAEAARAEAEQARAEAEAALQEAGREREARAQLMHERRGDLQRLTRQFEQSVSNVAGSVSQAAKALDAAAETLDHVASETGNRASAAASAAAQSKMTVRDVANTISTLTQSMTGIAAIAAQQSSLANVAEGCSRKGDETVSDLSDSSDTIGFATNAISDIAKRTSILALNATIEAARSGDSGKGFAVVANEVKNLAMEAGKATGQISQILTEIRIGTDEAETSFAGIASSVAELTESARAIQSAVEEQQAAAANIERHAVETSAGVDEMARSIEEVSDSAEKTGALSGEVRRSVSVLVDQVALLEGATQEFVGVLNAA